MRLYLGSIFIVAIEISCCKIFFEIFMQKKNVITKSLRPLWMISFILIDFSFIVIFSKNFFVKQVAAILIYSFFIGIYFKIRNTNVVVYSVLFQALLLTIDYVILTFMRMIDQKNIIFSISVSNNELIVILSKAVLFICVLMIKRCWSIKHKNFEIMSNREWMKLLSFSLMTICTIVAMLFNFDIVNNDRQIHTVFIIACALIVMNIVQFSLINDIMNKEEQLRENELYKMKIHNQMMLYYSMSENLEKQRKAAHEYKNKIMCIGALLDRKKYDDLERYVTELNENIIDELNVIDTNNVIVNAVLNTKFTEAKKKDILLIFRVNDLSNINMDDTDIVILLSNLLNNAIEATEKCKEKRIVKVKMVYEEQTLILSVKNTFEHTLNVDNGILNTTKKNNVEKHGIGLKNAIEVIEKYKGSYAVNYDNNEFEFSILLIR